MFEYNYSVLIRKYPLALYNVFDYEFKLEAGVVALFYWLKGYDVKVVTYSKKDVPHGT